MTNQTVHDWFPIAMMAVLAVRYVVRNRLQ